MTHLRLSVPPLLLGLVVLAGCGKGSATSSTATPDARSGTPAPIPTQHIPPTLTVKGGSTAVVVNGQPVSMSDFRTLLTITQRQSVGQPGSNPKALAARAMHQLVLFTIVRQYASAHHLTASPAEINARIHQDELQSGGQKGLEQRLAQFGLTLGQYKLLIIPSLLAQKVMQKVIPVHSSLEPVAHVRHILIALHPQGKPARTDAAAHSLAQNVLSQLQHGGKFASLAQKYSDDPGSAAAGGDLHNVYPGQTVAPFDHAAFTQPLNTPTIVKSQFGYHILEVLSRGKAPVPQAQQQRMQQQKFGTWLEDQARSAKVRQIAQVKG